MIDEQLVLVVELDRLLKEELCDAMRLDAFIGLVVIVFYFATVYAYLYFMWQFSICIGMYYFLKCIDHCSSEQNDTMSVSGQKSIILASVVLYTQVFDFELVAWTGKSMDY